MPVRDMLLQLNSYEIPTPRWAIEAAFRLSGHYDARLSAALCRVHIPKMSNYLADKLVGAGDLIAAENAKSDRNARDLLAAFEAVVPAWRRDEHILIDCHLTVAPWRVAERARLYDLTIIPCHGDPQTAFIAEGLAFDSGRPVLLLPERAVERGFQKIVIGWDGSRAAARALADALPFCAGAGSVALAAVTGEKPFYAEAALADARRHLAAHGIDAASVAVAADGQDAGAALLRHCAEAGADLLVMGAYGHSRFREFVLGGATRSVLAQPAIPILMSH